MKTEHIQVNYEDTLNHLPKKTEKKIAEAIVVLMSELKQPQQTLSLFFCSPDTMTQLNGTYRGKQQPTDLLSWLYEEEEEEAGSISPEEPWGELIYCLDIIQKQASGSGWQLEDELLRSDMITKMTMMKPR